MNKTIVRTDDLQIDAITESLCTASGLEPRRLASLSQAVVYVLEVRIQRDQHRRQGQNELGLLEWGKKFLPRHFSSPSSAMHLWMQDQLDACRHRRGIKINVVGPRGHAKSTVGTLAYPLRAAVESLEPYIWIVSDTRQQATAHLDNLKAELTGNRALARAFPKAVGRGPVWRRDAIVLRNGVKIEAVSTGQHIRGRRHGAARPTMIVCDDLQNDAHMSSAHQREHSRCWFHGTLMKAGTKHTNVLHLATALHREALAIELHRTPGWSSEIFPAIRHWPEAVELWQQWETLCTNFDDANRLDTAKEFFRAHQSEMELGATVLWPEEEDLYTLMTMRIEGGKTTFEREKQGQPLNPKMCEWPEEYFGDELWFDTWPRGLKVKTMALDPSKGNDASRGDYSALVMLGIDEQGVLYVEADLARRPTPRMVADGVALYRRFQPDGFTIEANQYQELLGREFAIEYKRQGLLAPDPWLVDNRVNKLVRIRRLGPYLSSKRLRFKAASPSTRLLVEQMRNFPLGDHDDGPDALEMAIRLAAELLEQDHSGDGLGNRLPVEK